MGPDADVAAELERCADRAGRAGGRLAEADYLARAAELSADATLAATRILSAADAALAGGAPLRSEVLLNSGHALFDAAGLRAKALRLREQIKYHTGRPLGQTRPRCWPLRWPLLRWTGSWPGEPRSRPLS